VRFGHVLAGSPHEAADLAREALAPLGSAWPRMVAGDNPGGVAAHHGGSALLPVELALLQYRELVRSERISMFLSRSLPGSSANALVMPRYANEEARAGIIA
jgi:hypothetical protein